MELSICERFPSLSPFDVRQKKAYDVFLLMRRLSNYNGYQDDNKKVKNGKTVIRKRAGDDWF